MAQQNSSSSPAPAAISAMLADVCLKCRDPYANSRPPADPKWPLVFMPELMGVTKKIAVDVGDLARADGLDGAPVGRQLPVVLVRGARLVLCVAAQLAEAIEL